MRRRPTRRRDDLRSAAGGRKSAIMTLSATPGVRLYFRLPGFLCRFLCSNSRKLRWEGQSGSVSARLACLRARAVGLPAYSFAACRPSRNPRGGSPSGLVTAVGGVAAPARTNGVVPCGTGNYGSGYCGRFSRPSLLIPELRMPWRHPTRRGTCFHAAKLAKTFLTWECYDKKLPRLTKGTEANQVLLCVSYLRNY